jgi:uncharacterized membrane protein (DUF2068 family)
MLYNLIGFFGGLTVLMLLSGLAFWKEKWAQLFMLAAGTAMMLGLETPRLLNPAGTASVITQQIGLVLSIYSLLLIAMSFRVMIWEESEDG